MTSAKSKQKRAMQEVTVRLFNSKDRQATFALEPWGETYPFASDDDFVVIARGPTPGSPEIDFGDETITVSGWPGSTVQLFRNGEELGAGFFKRTPVPEAPLEVPD